MIITEVRQDLFAVSEEYTLCHCISSDLAMGAGIAVQFQKLFNIRPQISKPVEYPTCRYTDRVYNLITKDRYFHKPTMETLTASVVAMRKLMKLNHHTKLAMPAIGCGLDRLKWSEVKAMLEKVFEDTDVEILVCFK